MGFVQIFRTKGVRRTSQIMARARLKDEACVLAINACGIDYLGSLAISLVKRDLVDLFFDSETGKIGVRKSKDGDFEMCPLSKNALRISSKDLARVVRQNQDYSIEKHEQFHFVLVPLNRKGDHNGTGTDESQPGQPPQH